jgi:hypothetical protein
MTDSEVMIDYQPVDERTNSNSANNDYSGNTEEEDDSSVDTQDAFLDMLGLSVGNDLPSLDLQEEEMEADVDVTQDDSSFSPQLSTISLPRKCSRHFYPPDDCLAFRIDNLYSKSACQQLIQTASARNVGGFQYITEATHTAPDGSKLSVQLQNPNPHKLSVFYHQPTVERMWQSLRACIMPRIQSFIQRTSCGKPLGLNPKLRVLRYDSSDNDRFESHFDATTMVGSNQKSLMTVLLYLNDGDGQEFEGGETLFLDKHIANTTQKDDHVTKVTPSAGSVVIFEHDLFHSGAPLLWGTKYVLRTDVLFASTDETNEACPQSASDPLAEEAGRPSETSDLVSDLCTELSLSSEEQAVLEDMGVLESTIDSFLAPGITMLKMMLQDSMDRDSIDRLVHTAARRVNS